MRIARGGVKDGAEIQRFLPGVVLAEDQHFVFCHIRKVVPLLCRRVHDSLIYDFHVLPNVAGSHAVTEDDVFRRDGGHVANNQRHRLNQLVLLATAPEIEAFKVPVFRHQPCEVLFNHGTHVGVNSTCVGSTAAVRSRLHAAFTSFTSHAVAVLVSTAADVVAASCTFEHFAAVLVIFVLNKLVVEQV